MRRECQREDIYQARSHTHIENTAAKCIQVLKRQNLPNTSLLRCVKLSSFINPEVVKSVLESMVLLEDWTACETTPFFGVEEVQATSASCVTDS